MKNSREALDNHLEAMFAFLDEDTPQVDFERFDSEDMKMMRMSIAKREKDFYGADDQDKL